MENLDQVLVYWEKDSEVNMMEPSREIIRIPLLHSKYLNILTRHRIAVKKAGFDISRLKKVKWEYYTGKMSKEELDALGWEPFRYTLKSDVSTYIDSDGDLIKLYEKKAYHEEVVDVCIAIMKELNNRTFQIKEHCIHERFINGSR